MENISRMPIKQMRLIIKLWDSPDKMGFADGKSEGGTVKELYKKGFVTPAGRFDRRLRWKIVESKFTENDIALMRQLAK